MDLFHFEREEDSLFEDLRFDRMREELYNRNKMVK